MTPKNMKESESTSFNKGNHAFQSKRPRAFQEVEIHRKDLEALVWMFPNLSANRQDGRMHAKKNIFSCHLSSKTPQTGTRNLLNLSMIWTWRWSLSNSNPRLLTPALPSSYFEHVEWHHRFQEFLPSLVRQSPWCPSSGSQHWYYRTKSPNLP